ncbi:MAG: DNA/RNA nuclease SfsA [Acidobacteriota bacterium]
MDLVPGRLVKGIFVERPNRFLVRCRIHGRGVVEAQMPNSGRLDELLLPGVTIYLADELESSRRRVPRAHRRAPRKTRYTAWAVDREGETIFIHTHQTNAVARNLLEQQRIPGLESAKVVRSEVPLGSSRFDFLMEENRERFFLEVKSVTLFGNGAALFPDAVTERGRRHLLELAGLGSDAARTDEPKPVVLFLVHSNRVERFLPDYHTYSSGCPGMDIVIEAEGSAQAAVDSLGLHREGGAGLRRLSSADEAHRKSSDLCRKARRAEV